MTSDLYNLFPLDDESDDCIPLKASNPLEEPTDFDFASSTPHPVLPETTTASEPNKSDQNSPAGVLPIILAENSSSPTKFRRQRSERSVGLKSVNLVAQRSGTPQPRAPETKPQPVDSILEVKPVEP
jgi:hypothetical protein